MSDERYISEIEDRLREAGAPPTPPDHLHAIARAEALGQPDVVDIRSVVRPSSRLADWCWPPPSSPPRPQPRW